MSAKRRSSSVPAGAVLLVAAMAVTLPASVGFAAEPVGISSGYDIDLDHAAQTLAEVAAEPDPASVECMAKVVLHEAGREPRDGKVAVARTLMNRLATGRMGASICEVVNQPGQFFRTAAYNPAQDGAAWTDAVAVARAVMLGSAGDVAPGAIFFHSAAARPSSFFRSRQRIATIGAQVFYR